MARAFLESIFLLSVLLRATPIRAKEVSVFFSANNNKTKILTDFGFFI